MLALIGLAYGNGFHADRIHTPLVDYVLDDCFQLISLLFLTVGKNNEAPAVYVHENPHALTSQ